MRKIKKYLPTVFLLLVFLLGLGILLYPTVSSLWNARVQSRAISAYNEDVAALSEEDFSSFLEGAKAYNEAIYKKGSSLMLSDPDAVEGYFDTLNVSRDGVIAYVTIEKIGVNLPIYHGSGDASLALGAGHLQGTSLPIGGENTHCVISAHRGLPSARMFTDLDKLEVGDVFTITSLGTVLAYEVDQITTVLPEEMEDLYIEPGKDYCTLVTCTPYGINTHRLLVRGHRVPYVEPEEEPAIETPLDIVEQINYFWVYIAAAVILVLVISEILVRVIRKRQKKEDKKDDKQETNDEKQSVT